MDLDEIDLAILDLYTYADEHGVSAVQMMRRLQQAIADAYLIVADLEDERAIDPMPTTTFH